jgi:hypothetical protein
VRALASRLAQALGGGAALGLDALDGGGFVHAEPGLVASRPEPIV